MTSSPALELVDLSYSYGGVQALRRISLPIYSGQILGILGDTGAGKSTLAQILAGVRTPSSGHLVQHGEPLHLTSTARGREAGIVAVFQELGLIEDFSVANNVFLGQWPRRRWFQRQPKRGQHELHGTGWVDEIEAEKRAAQLLHQLGIKVDSVHAPVSTLSASQRQGVAVARALLGEPQVVIFDEPTASLSIRQSAQVYTLMNRLRARGLAVVVMSHQIGELQSVADRIGVLRLGKLVSNFAATTPYEELLAAMTGQLASATALDRRPEEW